MDWLDNDEEIAQRRIDPNNISTNENDKPKNNESSSTKELEDKLMQEKIKVNRLQNEIENLKHSNKSNNLNSINQYIHEINFNQLKLGKKIGQGGFSEIYETNWYFIINRLISE